MFVTILKQLTADDPDLCVCQGLTKIAVTVIHIILLRFHLLNQSTKIKHTVNMADLTSTRKMGCPHYNPP